jgi:orotate phosphoribosyltransferase
VNYRSVADLDDQIVAWLRKLPRDLEVIVGIPRSGLLVANLLALHLNLPMTDVDGFLQGRMLQQGRRSKPEDINAFLSRSRKVLVVDDSVLSGTQLAIVREKITAFETAHDVRFAAPYVAPGREDYVDFYAEVLPSPRCFEWNLMHHKVFLSNTCMDIDGVLCRDPEESENDDGPNYECFLHRAEPLYLPTHPVRWLVTSRLERYRAATEAWLVRHGVEYGELLMMDYPDMAARRAAQAYACFKAEIYLKTRACLFIESSIRLSQQIAELTGYDVFCMDTREMIRPGSGSARRRKIFDAPRTLRCQLAGAVKKARRIPGNIARRTARAYRRVLRKGV